MHLDHADHTDVSGREITLRHPITELCMQL